MATMNVDVVSAEEQLFSGEANAVFARSVDGEIGILPGHQPALLALATAPLRVQTVGGEELVFAVHEGFLEFRENHLTVLADTAERAEDIDVRRAEQRLRELESRQSDEGGAELQALIARNQLRIDIGGA